MHQQSHWPTVTTGLSTETAPREIAVQENILQKFTLEVRSCLSAAVPH